LHRVKNRGRRVLLKAYAKLFTVYQALSWAKSVGPSGKGGEDGTQKGRERGSKKGKHNEEK